MKNNTCRTGVEYQLMLLMWLMLFRILWFAGSALIQICLSMIWIFILYYVNSGLPLRDVEICGCYSWVEQQGEQMEEAVKHGIDLETSQFTLLKVLLSSHPVFWYSLCHKCFLPSLFQFIMHNYPHFIKWLDMCTASQKCFFHVIKIFTISEIKKVLNISFSS
jgi:hypothetical protein